MSPKATLRWSWILACGIPAIAVAEEVAEARRVTVSGTAVTTTVPDVIVWRLTTKDFDKSLLAAKKQSDGKLRAVLGLQEELGVRPEDLQTGRLSIRKEYERDRSGNQGAFKHFAVTRDVTLKQRDLKRFDEYLTKFVSSAELDVDFSFESSRVHDLRRETRLQAVRVAKEKAAAMTAELGAKLGKVLSIEEHGRAPSYSNFMSNTAIVDPSGREADVISGTFAPGSVQVRISVQVTFGIE